MAPGRYISLALWAFAPQKRARLKQDQNGVLYNTESKKVNPITQPEGRVPTYKDFILRMWEQYFKHRVENAC